MGERDVKPVQDGREDVEQRCLACDMWRPYPCCCLTWLLILEPRDPRSRGDRTNRGWCVPGLYRLVRHEGLSRSQRIKLIKFVSGKQHWCFLKISFSDIGILLAKGEWYPVVWAEYHQGVLHQPSPGHLGQHKPHPLTPRYNVTRDLSVSPDPVWRVWCTEQRCQPWWLRCRAASRGHEPGHGEA